MKRLLPKEIHRPSNGTTPVFATYFAGRDWRVPCWASKTDMEGWRWSGKCSRQLHPLLQLQLLSPCLALLLMIACLPSVLPSPQKVVLPPGRASSSSANAFSRAFVTPGDSAGPAPKALSLRGSSCYSQFFQDNLQHRLTSRDGRSSAQVQD